MLFDNNNIDFDLSFFNMNKINNDNVDTRKFLSAKEGFLKGNMFKNEYLPYKNLTFVDIKPKNDREAKMFTVMQYSFAINDLNLYLDVNPEDKNALYLLEKLIEEEKKAKKEYVTLYGPLNICDTKDKYNWISSPWSWETDRGDLYV